MTATERTIVLAVDDEVYRHEIITEQVEFEHPTLTAMSAETEVDALRIIAEFGDRILAVITDNHLIGETGAAGRTITTAAREAGVQKVVILTGRPTQVTAPDGVVVWSKGDFSLSQLDELLTAV